MKRLGIIAIIILALALNACNRQSSNNQDAEAKDKEKKAAKEIETEDEAQGEIEGEGQVPTESSEGEQAEEKEVLKLKLSNMADEASLAEVRQALLAELKEENVEAFLHLVKDYNDAVENKNLVGGFTVCTQPEYDVEMLDALWKTKKGDFLGTNCRLNSYTLLRGDIEINKKESDDRLLFLDNNSISVGEVLDGEDAELFRILFSRVKTEATKDIRVHAEKMKAHYKDMKFPEGSSMVSLVIHDNLEGDYLFVGHVGVMVKNGDGYLFVEKLSFDEPYQAIKFETKEDCYKYLYLKYKHYRDETTAGPFIMDNADFVELKEYNSPD